MLKRTFDLLVAVLGLILGAPLAIVIAILIKRETPGPALTTRVCVGRDGAPFTLYHFRTMTIAAPPAPSTRTPLGRALCNYSLNDYPTLWSVLRGDMSIIGPRPHRHDEIDWHHPDWQRVLRVKPGLLGPVLLALRERYNQTPIPVRTAIEAHYIDHHSFGDDMRLCIRGIRAVRQMGHIKGKI